MSNTPDDALHQTTPLGDQTSFSAARNLMDAEVEESVIGHYHLLQRIGEGGMGEVWLAEQKHPVRRRVAIKLVKAGMNTREVVARFESERQALALMDHPAIAKVFDAGSTLRGAPYFVMEYVAGLPITDYCDKHKLTTRERLSLFMLVCEGVQHAHQKAIIHRDLKPSNILVSEIDGRAVPKIIDFGVAKALSQRLTEQTMFTRVGSVIGTPEYMSPEQANSGGEDIDTRTDVYSLGVILYELLVGVRPLDLKKAAYDEMLRKLREEDAVKPSTRLKTLGDQTAVAARNRHTQPSTLVRQLRGELDSITLKSLEKDRSRRYGSPSDFAADIGRYIRNEPVQATPPSFGYRARKFAHRNRGLIATLSVLAAALVLGAGISVWQAVRARQAERVATQQRDRADAEAATAKAVNEFLQEDLLSQASSEAQSGADVKPDPDVKVRVLLDRAAARIGSKFGKKPLVESAIRDTIGNTYRNLGLFAEAEQQLRTAYDLSRQHRGEADIRTLELLREVADLISDRGKLQEALAMKEHIFDIENRQLGPENPTTLITMQDLGVAYLLLGQYGKAEPLLNKALASQSRIHGYDNAATLDTSDSLATLYIDRGEFPQAEILLRKGLDSYRRVFGPEHPFTQREMFGLGRVYFGEGKYSDAEQVIAQVLASNQRLEGMEHPNTISTARFLGRILSAEGKFAQATPLLEKTVQQSTKVLGPEHPDTLAVMDVLASSYSDQGRNAQAEALWKTILEGYRRALGSENPQTVYAMEKLAACWMHDRKFAEAEAVFRRSLDLRVKADPDGWRRYESESLLGVSLANQGKYAAAEPLLVEGYKGIKQRESKISASQKKLMLEAGEQVVELYSKWEKPAEAAQWREQLLRRK